MQGFVEKSLVFELGYTLLALQTRLLQVHWLSALGGHYAVAPAQGATLLAQVRVLHEVKRLLLARRGRADVLDWALLVDGSLHTRLLPVLVLYYEGLARVSLLGLADVMREVLRVSDLGRLGRVALTGGLGDE